MNWSGISNENEFYSEHYLAEVFSGDVKDLLDAWLEQERSARAEATGGQVIENTRTPYNQLASLARPWQQTERELSRSRSSAEKLAAQRPWLQSLCECLGLPWQPQAHSLSDDCVVPLLAALHILKVAHTTSRHGLNSAHWIWMAPCTDIVSALPETQARTRSVYGI